LRPRIWAPLAEDAQVTAQVASLGGHFHLCPTMRVGSSRGIDIFQIITEASRPGMLACTKA